MLKFFPGNRKIKAAVSFKEDGSMGRINSGNRAEVLGNRQRFLEKAGFKGKKLVMAEMVHGKRVGIVEKLPPQGVYLGVDGLVTKDGRFALGATGADCGLVFWADKKAGVVGVCHAGWRGIAAGIIAETWRKMELLGAEAFDVEVVIGPIISQENFEVAREVAELFEGLGFKEEVLGKGQKYWVDLAGVIKKQVIGEGMRGNQVFIQGDCTYNKRKQYFSFRRSQDEGRELEGVMLGVIGINN